MSISLDGFVAGPNQSLEDPVKAIASPAVTHTKYRVVH
jgi:hypothetical protein